MRLLSDDELASLHPSETATFPGPIPTQSVSSDEFMPSPQDGPARSNLRHGYVVPARG